MKFYRVQKKLRNRFRSSTHQISKFSGKISIFWQVNIAIKIGRFDNVRFGCGVVKRTPLARNQATWRLSTSHRAAAVSTSWRPLLWFVLDYLIGCVTSTSVAQRRFADMLLDLGFERAMPAHARRCVQKKTKRILSKGGSVRKRHILHGKKYEIQFAKFVCSLRKKNRKFVIEYRNSSNFDVEANIVKTGWYSDVFDTSGVIWSKW